jgi:hypothetical protein
MSCNFSIVASWEWPKRLSAPSEMMGNWVARGEPCTLKFLRTVLGVDRDSKMCYIGSKIGRSSIEVSKQRR